MNTHTNSIHPKKAVPQTTRNRLFQNIAAMTVVLALVVVAAIVILIANRPVAAENNPSVTYGNALEMQYARPWLDAQNKPVVAYGNALELQYAQPWQLPIVVTGDAREQISLNCHSSLELLYACKYGYGRP